MKNVLIISPYFPPVNTADMHRVRMSLPYFHENGWEAEVITVAHQYTNLYKDELLLESVWPNIKIHYVKAFNKKWTSKLGFGSISYLSFWFYNKTVKRLLKNKNYSLIYFSTTQFQLCILGAWWKKDFNIPYVMDIQDLWHSDYQAAVIRASRRNPKHWFVYHLNKFLEALAIKHAGGLISVSENYISILKKRYPQINHIPAATITFSAFSTDFSIAAKHSGRFLPMLKPGFKNIVYIGRGGTDMYNAIKPFFETLKKGLCEEHNHFNKLIIYFIGTSYAPLGQGKATILPLAQQYGIENNIIEIPGRIGYYHALATLQQADALFVPGSDDANYTASKIFPYLFTAKPLLAIFNSQSSALKIMEEFGVTQSYSYDKTKNLIFKINGFLTRVVNGQNQTAEYRIEAMEKYSAQVMTKQQCDLFNEAIATYE